MPAIDFSLPHSFDPDEVVSRLKGFIARLRERNEAKFQVRSEEWNDRELNCSFSSYSFPMDAVMRVEPGQLRFHIDIPFAAMVFKGQIEQRLREEISKLLA